MFKYLYYYWDSGVSSLFLYYGPRTRRLFYYWNNEDDRRSFLYSACKILHNTATEILLNGLSTPPPFIILCTSSQSSILYRFNPVVCTNNLYSNHFKADWHLLSIWVILLHVAYRLYLRGDYKYWYNSDMYEYVYPILTIKKLYTMVQRMFLIVDFFVFRWYNTYKSTLLMVVVVPFNLIRYLQYLIGVVLR